MTDFATYAILAIFPLCMIFAAFYDIFTMTIPNKISILLVASFAIFAPFAGMGFETALWHVGVGLLALAIGFGLFSLGVLGGGDAKLIAASSLWFGTAWTFEYVFLAGILGGALTVFIIVMRRINLPSSILKFNWIGRLHDRTNGVPYGAALGPAALLVFPDTPWMNFITNGVGLG